MNKPNGNIPEAIIPFLSNIPEAFIPFIQRIDSEDWNNLQRVDGINNVINGLKNRYDKNTTVSCDDIKYKWIGASIFYRYFRNQYPNAIAVANALYQLMIDYQLEEGKWVHKGLPLVYIRDFQMLLHHSVLAKRYAMLTLCEDSIGDNKSIGHLKKNERMIFSRLTYYHGMSEEEIDYYFDEINKHFDDTELSRFPEWILQQIGPDWITEFPTNAELITYTPNLKYISKLISRLPNDKSGKNLEILAEYVLSIIPGFRTYRRVRTPSTDYDILCSIEGSTIDFRSELGRYVVCECKNWKKPADFSAIAKLCNVIDSVKCKSGIIFSKKGVTGDKNYKNARREILKVFQRNGITIIVIDETDLNKVSEGFNFVSILRKKYEQTRFDIEK